MKLSKQAKKMADELGLNEVDAYIMELKAQLYRKSAQLINSSDLTHEEIAKKIGTSRARINRISKMGENSISMELLIKLIASLDDVSPIKFVA